MREAVSDSSPLIHLAAIGRLELLHSFHEAVLIPDAVWREVVTQAVTGPESAKCCMRRTPVG